MKVVDAAERRITLIQSFNSVLTNQQEQRQFLLQVVAKHRREYTDMNKSMLIGTSNDKWQLKKQFY